MKFSNKEESRLIFSISSNIPIQKRKNEVIKLLRSVPPFNDSYYNDNDVYNLEVNFEKTKCCNKEYNFSFEGMPLEDFSCECGKTKLIEYDIYKRRWHHKLKNWYHNLKEWKKLIMSATTGIISGIIIFKIILKNFN